MDRSFYLDLAKKGQRLIFGTNLILEQKPDAHEIALDGKRLGKIYIDAAGEFGSPIALPLMDLTIEKNELLHLLGIEDKLRDTYRFEENLSETILNALKQNMKSEPTPELVSYCEAIRYVKQNSDLMPAGMLIGPFSLMTKLLADPIVPVFIASSGVTGEEDPSVHTIEILLDMAVTVIRRSAQMQIEAGAKLICICEPAANTAFISPDMLTEDTDVFDRYVLSYNNKILELMNAAGVDLLLHDCGELSDAMIQKLCKLRPVILSLGSSRELWHDAHLVPKDIVLFGNVSTKNLMYIPEVKLKQTVRDLREKMEASGHPFILGSECDIMSIPGYEKLLFERARMILTCR